MSSSKLVICEWPASLYLDRKRRWVFGNLSILYDRVTFTAEPTPENTLTKVIPFEEFIDVKKATTGLVFGAIYILKKNNEKVWISSLSDREGVYGALAHFWRSQLIPEDKSKSVASRERTEKGAALIGILKDSENTLSKAASQLQSQGTQIDHSLGNMLDIHNDLDVADNLVEDIDSWFGSWQLPRREVQIDPVFVNKSDIPDVFEYEIIYTKLEPGKANMRHVGLLRISKEGIIVMTEKQKTVQSYRWGDVSQIRVVTPYEIMLIKFQIGQPDLTFGIVSASMVAVLKLLSKCANYKLKYDTPPENVVCMKHGSRDKAVQRNLSSHHQYQYGETYSSEESSSQRQIRTNQSAQVVSDTEANEISRTLGALKSLAIAVQQEGASQNEKLDELRGTVDRANDRLTSTEKRIKRMI